MLCENDNEKYSRNPLQLQKSCYTKGHGKGVEAMMTMPEGKAACTVRGITYRYVVKYNGGGITRPAKYKICALRRRRYSETEGRWAGLRLWSFFGVRRGIFVWRIA